jgi:hypothetical protein
MRSDAIAIVGVGFQDPTQMRLAQDNDVVHTHSRRIDPISRSAKPFCQGEAGAVGLSRMPMARNARVTIVCIQNLIRVDDVTESPKLAE